MGRAKVARFFAESSPDEELFFGGHNFQRFQVSCSRQNADDSLAIPARDPRRGRKFDFAWQGIGVVGLGTALWAFPNP
jgi:hypothetical protein